MQNRSIDVTTDIKGLKRPDKALPCPRCNSYDTKFCYYNNYNVNQPRHFCKGCQRYWTAGGILRNVAIGAGRRKRKHTSLELDSITMDDSANEHCSSVHDFSSIEFSGNLSCGSAEGAFAHTRPSPELVKPKALPFDARAFAAASNPSSLNTLRSVPHDYNTQSQIVAPRDMVVPFCNGHSIREQASTYHEFLHSKHIAAPHDKVGAPCNSHAHSYDSVHVEQMTTVRSHLHAESQKNKCIDLGSTLVSTTSSTRQASNESGCASSSLTTLAASVDACATDGKSDAMDSEVAKEGDEVDKEGSLINEALQSTRSLPCKMQILGGASATSSYAHCDASIVVTCTQMPGQPENPAFGAARAQMPGPLENLPFGATHAQMPGSLEHPAFGAACPSMSSPMLTWGPQTGRTLFWGFPWGPAANAVDAAKAALIPQKFQQTERHANAPSAPSEMRLWVPKTLRIKDVDEAARSSIWSTLGIRDRQGSILSENAKEVFQCYAVKEGDVVSVQSQYANPVALTQSMAFQESS